jgi:hypothetical protein
MSRRHRAAYDAWATALLLRLVDAASSTVTSLRHLDELAPFRPPASTVEIDQGRGQAQQSSLWPSPSDPSGR